MGARGESAEQPGEVSLGDALAEPLSVLGNEKRLHLLGYLTTPHYIREIASEMSITRQSAQAHVDKLVEIGVLERRRGRREHGPVTEYVVVPQRLFALQDRFAQLGRLEPEVDDEDVRAVTEPLADEERRDAAPAVSRLLIVHGYRRGRTVPLEGAGPWMIGRDPSAQVCLDVDPFVSTRHAEIRRSGASFELADLYSRNGTSLDWAPLDRGEERELEEGSLVGVGRTSLVFRTP